MVHQHFRLVEPFSVAENVVLGDHRGEGGRAILRPSATERRVEELGQRYGLAVSPKAKIWQLSIGEQQRVEILKALYRDARVLILDEPTAVLTPQEAEGLFETLRAMADEGKTVIFISHKLHEVKAVADRVTVLRGGKTVATVDAAPSTLRSLATLMVGREVDFAPPLEQARRLADVQALEVDGLTVSGDRGEIAVNDVSFAIREGEIVGVAGVAGNGQRELAEALSGMRDIDAGSVRISGRLLRGGDPREAILAGVAHVPGGSSRHGARPEPERHEQRRHEDLPAALALARAAPRAPTHARGRGQDRPALRREDPWDRDAGAQSLRREPPEAHPRPGVRRRPATSSSSPSPPAGSTSARSRRCTRTFATRLRRGVAILLMSEDLDEIRALADRILVVYEGEIVGELHAGAASIEEIGLLMAGGAGA